MRIRTTTAARSTTAQDVLVYSGAAASYIAIGVFFTEFALSWIVALGWLLLWVWGLPALVRRVRRR